MEHEVALAATAAPLPALADDVPQLQPIGQMQPSQASPSQMQVTGRVTYSRFLETWHQLGIFWCHKTASLRSLGGNGPQHPNTSNKNTSLAGIRMTHVEPMFRKVQVDEQVYNRLKQEDW